MAVSMLSRCGPVALSGSGPRRTSAATSTSGTTFGVVRMTRPHLAPMQAHHRSRNCYSSWDEEATKRMMRDMEDMAKQWHEIGNVSGGFFWPGGGVYYGGVKSQAPSDPTTAAPTRTSSSPPLPLDSVSTDGFYLVYADVPVLSKSDLSIKLSKERVLTIAGERKPPVEEEGFIQKERRFGPFEGKWELPEDADSEGISAKVSEGVLTITVPKKQPEPEVDDAQDIAIN